MLVRRPLCAKRLYQSVSLSRDTCSYFFFFFSSRRRHTRCSRDWSSDVCSSDLVPGDGDTYFLPRLVGPAKALELLWTADFIEAPEALRLGIVQRVVPDAELRDATYAFARQIADGPQVPIRMIKRLVYQSMKLDLRTHLDLVSSHMAIVRQTADHKEGVAAFTEKRAPKFQGRELD